MKRESELLLKDELLEVFNDCKEIGNILFRGFLLGNYKKSCLKKNFPILYKYVNSFGLD